MSLALNLAEAGFVPDGLIRAGIRRLLQRRLQQESRRDTAALLKTWHQGPIAVAQDAANWQHYEVPAAFYAHCLGPHRKYSSCWWDETTADLAAAEAKMLAITCERAGLADGQEILEIGCGWGSLTLWMAQQYPSARIRAVSNSASQRAYILGQAAQRGLGNIQIDTADISHYQAPGHYDRVVSVECLEHVRNHAALFARVRAWLKPQGSVFIHVFCHEHYLYPFEDEGQDDWMARHFFTGGIMPSFDLFDRCGSDLRVVESWRVNGQHYARTARAWLENLDANKNQALAVLQAMPPFAQRGAAKRQLQRWRMFFLACEELFAARGGTEWLVGHYRLEAAAS